MGRHAKAWKLEWRRGIGYVRFSHQKKQYLVSTGTRDLGKALAEAARLYSRIIGGSAAIAREPKSLVLVPLRELCAEWLASLQGILDPLTLKTYEETYVGKHWLGHYDTIESMCSEIERGRYVSNRLQRALAGTVQKEVWVQDKFLLWCRKKAKVIDVTPPRIEWDKRTLGTRTGRQRAKARELTLQQVQSFLDVLPGWLETGRRATKKKPVPVRARFVLEYETSLRPATLNELVWGDWKGGTLTIRPETDKVRFGRDLPLTSIAIETLERTRDESIERGLPVGQKDLIFGKHAHWKTLKKAAQKVGLDGVNPYDLRHGRATHMADASASLTGIGQMLGHKQASTTSRYLHASKRAAQEAIELADKHRILGTFQVRGLLPPAAVPDKSPKSLGDRRGSNPRQLEPQSSSSYTEYAENKAIDAVYEGEQEPRETGENRLSATNSGYVPRIRHRPASWVHEAVANLSLLLAGVAS